MTSPAPSTSSVNATMGIVLVACWATRGAKSPLPRSPPPSDARARRQAPGDVEVLFWSNALDYEIFAFNESCLTQSFAKRLKAWRSWGRGARPQNTHPAHVLRRLGAHDDWPRRHSAAEKRYELAPLQLSPLKQPRIFRPAASGNRADVGVKSRHSQCKRSCPLWVNSGHMQCKKSCPLYPEADMCSAPTHVR